MDKFRMTNRIASAAMLLILVVGVISACAPATQTPVKLDKVTWVSPRGTLEVMDDANLWVSEELGYFEEMGIELDAQGGPNESHACVRMVAEGQADVGYPSPGVLVTGNDTGIPATMAWEMMMKQVFDFAVPKGSDIDEVTDLEGKTICLGSEGWTTIVDPILYEAGVPLDSVEYVNAGWPGWGQATAQGQCDAALGWRGLSADWDAAGLEMDYLVGKTFSKHPANGYAIRRSDLDDAERVEILTRFFKAVAMGLEFSRLNPRAAAQIAYKQFPAYAEQYKPEHAFASMWELNCNYWDGYYAGEGYGYANIEGWDSYLDAVYELGQIKTRPKTEDIVTNFFIKEANEFDHERVKKDAESFKLDPEFEAIVVPSEC